MALATLSKGLIGLVLPGGALVVYTLLHARLRAVAAAAPRTRTASFFGAARALVRRSWRARNDEFLQFFFVHEHFQRFLTTDAPAHGAWWYFVPCLAAGLLPWLLVLRVRAAPAGATAGPRAGNGFSWQRFALVWAAFVFVFFSASGSKLPSYILPMFPALALLVGWRPGRRRSALARAPRRWR